MLTVLNSLNSALRQALVSDPRVYILGEDIVDPYGGAFKVTRGLSTDFPDRVIAMPVSEAAMVGVAGGMALRGLLPVVEIMFGDFITLAADQLINHLAKFHHMYNNQVDVPVVIRTPMGGRRSYGPTHSQSLEKIFMGVPGLTVLAPNPFTDPGSLLLDAIFNIPDPVLFVENKLLYSLPLEELENNQDFSFEVFKRPARSGMYRDLDINHSTNLAHWCTMTIRSAPPPQLTIVAYGYMAWLSAQAARELAYEHEVFCELLVPDQLAPFEIEPILRSVRQTGRILAVEEGTYTLGWGAEILALIAEKIPGYPLQARRLAARDSHIPASKPLEDWVLPDVADIVKTALEMV